MVLLFGSRSQLGVSFLKNTSFKTLSFNSDQFNALKISNLELFLDSLENKFDIILNFISNNDVENCNREEANIVNCQFPEKLANYCKKNNKILIHLSSDYVFDGNTGSYIEDSSINPLNTYGISKASGEEAIKNSGCNFFILRTSWLYSHLKTQNNFLNKIVSLANDESIGELYGADDVFGSPTSCSTVSNCIELIIQNIYKSIHKDLINFGIYNIVDTGRVSRFEFMQEALKLLRIRYSLEKKIFPVKSDHFKSNIIRPVDTSLLNSKFSKVYAYNFQLWSSSLKVEVEKL